jgi:hypothetical protein
MYTPDDFPTFHNLTHLVINNNSDLVVQLLHNCPKLQNLDLYQVSLRIVFSLFIFSYDTTLMIKFCFAGY